MPKKKSPYTETVEAIFAELDQQQSRAMERAQYIKVLKEIRWNLKKVWAKLPDSPYVGQALGLAKGALGGLGEDPEAD